jgi:hypothetical protein
MLVGRFKPRQIAMTLENLGLTFFFFMSYKVLDVNCVRSASCSTDIPRHSKTLFNASLNPLGMERCIAVIILM